MWEVEFTNEFERWWGTLTQEQQEAVSRRVGQLEQLGPALGRPAVDTLVGSAVPNLKELRTSSGGCIAGLVCVRPAAHGHPATWWRQDGSLEAVVRRGNSASGTTVRRTSIGATSRRVDQR